MKNKVIEQARTIISSALTIIQSLQARMMLIDYYQM